MSYRPGPLHRLQRHCGFGGVGSPRRFTVSPAIGGKTEWNIDTDGPLDLSVAGVWDFTPHTNFVTHFKTWGGAGGDAGQDGGPAGAGTADIQWLRGVQYKVYVGGGGTISLGGLNGGANGGSAYGGFAAGGGGYSGLRLATGEPLLIAPGGGGASPAGKGGPGGGAVGAVGGGGSAGGLGGTQSAGGTGGLGQDAGGNPGVYGGVGIAFAGGIGRQTNAGDYSNAGGGGAGYFGGGGGGVFIFSHGGGGGGGSGFFDPALTANGILYAASNTDPGLAADPDRGSAGDPGFDGRVRIY